MRLTTLCYVERDGHWLMMHRVKKEDDENAGKWVGIGGHLEENESPEECIRREAMEEAGIRLKDLRLRGILTFIMPDWGNELTFLYTAHAAGEPLEDCDEGAFDWIPIGNVPDIPLWEGDKIFLPLLLTRKDLFSVKLVYEAGGVLKDYTIEG